MDIVLQSANSNHANQVYELICGLENYIFPKEEFIRIFKLNLLDDKVDYIIALYEDIIVGFGSLHTQYLLHHCGMVSEIQELIVSDKYQNKSIGKAIVDALIKKSINRSAILVEVACNKNRSHALDFYLSQKFLNTHNKLTFTQG